ncbi:MAG TPA: hypothetical protein VF476_04835 [Chitinophagaceae bacterium]
MSEPVKIELTYDGATESIYGEKVSGNIYKCLESSLFVDFINYGCEIEVEEAEGILKFLGLYKESPYDTKRYVLSGALIESKEFEGFKNEIMRLGGYWEQAMGGVLIFHVPKEKKEMINLLLKMLYAD